MSSVDPRPVLIAGAWSLSDKVDTFRAIHPRTLQPIGPRYPVSSRKDLQIALQAGSEAAMAMAVTAPEDVARFLEALAHRIEARRAGLVQTAAQETALPPSPRLAEVELPRTTRQLRQAAAAVRDGSWRAPTIDTSTHVRSMYGPLGGPVAVFGPNNFPFAFNSVGGGDFAAALAAGNPVIAKANPGHPQTTEMLAAEAHEALLESGLPPAAVQMVYQMPYEEGKWFVAHPLLGATAYTGSRASALALKRAADLAGKLFYMETGSVNPVVILPGALEERADEIARELVASCLMGTGQFCTQPGLVFVLAGERSEAFIADVVRGFEEAPVGTLLSKGVAENLVRSVEGLRKAGAERLTGGRPGGGEGASYRNTVLRVPARRFLKRPVDLEREAFGNETLFVVAEDPTNLVAALGALEGNLTGSVYTRRDVSEDDLYDEVASVLRRKVGRLINDQMPTGVAVCAAMNHGGPYPATSHPGFTAVGIPPALLRFAALHCYDNVRPHRLPVELQDRNPTGRLWRRIDGEWTTADVPS